MIEIFNGEKLSFMKRCVRKIGYNFIFPVVLALILLATGFYNTVTYNNPIYYLFPLYFLFLLISNIVESKVYIRSINYSTNSGEFVFLISIFNGQKEYRVHKNDIEIEICQYAIYTRTRNYYLRLRFKNENIFRQFDYDPWNYKVMKEIVGKFKFLQR